LLFGLAPALQASRPDLNTVIKQDLAGAAGTRGGRLRGTLIGVQIALCMALMMATGLLLRGLQATYTIDPGYTVENIAHLSFGTDGGPPILDRRMLDEVAALPGVEAAAYASQTPLGESVTNFVLRLPTDPADRFRFAEIDAVTPEFFSMLEIPLLRGRSFTAADSADAAREASTRPVIVTAATARNFWGEADPLGHTLLLEDTTLEVVGVAADARLNGLGAVDPYYVYMPRYEGGELLVKIRGDFAATAASILALVRSRDAGAVARVLPLAANLAWYRSLSGLVTTLGAGLGVLALVLATVGVYAIVSYGVRTRYRELGIRMALGARARDLLGMVLRRTMRPVAIGAAVGIVAAAALARVLASVLFGVSPADPFGLGAAMVLVLGVAVAAGALAALPATRAQPTTTLRYE
jgi:predicted permease